MFRVSAALVAATLTFLPAQAATPARTQVSPDAIRAHMAFLADDLLEGRLAGTRGYTLAARYVAAQFTLAGLAPGARGGSWYQDVPMVEGLAVIPAAKLALFGADGTRTEFAAPDDFLPTADVNAASSTLRAPLVFVGYGIHAPEQQYDDLAGLDLRGRIAVLLTGAPPRFDSALRAHYSSTLTKYPELIRRGAIGVLAVLTPVDLKRNPWERYVQQSWRPRMRWIGADGQPGVSFPELRANAQLSPAGARRLFAASPVPLDAVFEAAEASQPQGFALPGEVELTRQTVIGRRSSENVVGLLEGSDPALRNEYVVLTAHLDHVGRGPPVNGDAIYNGALDNASGVAVMIEVARVLAGSRKRPKRSILFVAVTAEESGLLGSDYFAQQPPVPRSALVANINMDMPAVLAPVADLVGYGAEQSTLGDVAARAARAAGLRLSPDPKPEETIFVRSDQYSFVRQGIPSLYLDSGLGSIDPAQDQKGRYAVFLKDRYHQPSDDLTASIHYPSLARLAEVNARIAREVADTREKPRWHPDSFFGKVFGHGR